MSDVQKLEDDLNAMILKGEILPAFEKYYADDCVMQENLDTPREGKDACRKYEEAFLSSVKEFHGAELLSSLAGNDVSFSEWVFDVTLKDGPHLRNTQATRRQWKDGKIVHERFYYTPNVVED